eukprot:3995666-Amphidinium_carterae.1
MGDEMDALIRLRLEESIKYIFMGLHTAQLHEFCHWHAVRWEATCIVRLSHLATYNIDSLDMAAGPSPVRLGGTACTRLKCPHQLDMLLPQSAVLNDGHNLSQHGCINPPRDSTG